jgi:isopenicillin N synthase-like dioxygenase
MTEAIPVIDISDYLAGKSGALAATARRVGEALETVGFFVLTGHDVPASRIATTFAQAERFHRMPMAKKLALKLNEHVNGYMAMGRYAVVTSELNDNDQGDLNEAFFIKRERAPDDPLRRSRRRFVGPNRWPEETDLPGFRANLPRLCRGDGRVRAPVYAGGRSGARPCRGLVRRGLCRQPVHIAPALSAGRRTP